MEISELIKDQIYFDITDKKIPLRFTGKTEERNQYNSYCVIAYFKPVKTQINKNWYNSEPIITKAFSPCNERILKL